MKFFVFIFLISRGIQLTNEFKFPIAAFHHAHEAYLVPDLIKKAWGTTPAIAVFATNARSRLVYTMGSRYLCASKQV